MLTLIRDAVARARAAASMAWIFVKTREPVVVINTAVLLAVAVQQAWTAELSPGDSWGTALWIGLTVVLRQFVSPAAKA